MEYEAYERCLASGLRDLRKLRGRARRDPDLTDRQRGDVRARIDELLEDDRREQALGRELETRLHHSFGGSVRGLDAFVGPSAVDEALREIAAELDMPLPTRLRDGVWEREPASVLLSPEEDAEMLRTGESPYDIAARRSS